MSQLTIEYIKDHDFQFNDSSDEWKFVTRDDEHSEQGYAYTSVYQNTETKEYWAFNHTWDSWVGEREFDGEPFQVFQKEVVVTQYVTAAGYAVA